MSKSPSGRPPAAITRVICASVSLVQGSVMEHLFLRRNRLLAAGRDPLVKCALLYASGWFVCWLEGPQEAVEKVLQRLAADPHNERQAVIHRSRGAATLTEPLGIVVTQSTEGAGAYERRIRQYRQDPERSATMEPAAVWQCLSAPCTVPNDISHSRRPDRHVALVSAEDNGPIDLLRKLGERFGSRVVYQRFAGARSHSTDVGLAYVDVQVEREIRRIYLLSRRALGLPLVHRTLEGLDEMVMLMGSRPGAAIELAASVADCVNALPRAPAICQVTDREEIAATIGRLLERSQTAARPLSVIQLREPQLEGFLLGGERLAPSLKVACI